MSARTERTPVTRVGASAPTRFALGLVLAGVALAGCSTQGASPVASVAPATAASTPATVAPVTAPATTTAPAPTTVAPATAPTTAAPLSPLASALGPRLSVLPEPVVTLPAPVGLTIEDLRLTDAPVIPVGIDPTGELEVPDETEVGWYRLGSSPGQPGAVVLAAHVSWNGKQGLFERLGRLEPGQRVVVGLADGTTRTYEVVERTMYGKEGLPPERIWTREGPETLVLITCGGTFNPALRSYNENIVVYAVPVA